MSNTSKLGRFLATKIVTESDSTVLDVVIEARSITPDNRSTLRTLCDTEIREETVTIAGVTMMVLSATMTVANIKILSSEPWIEKISTRQFISSRG